MVTVAVVGAGVIGLSTAYRLLTELHTSVTLISDKFSPDLTSDGAAGVWEPYILTEDDQRGVDWSGETYRYLMALALSHESIACGTSVIRYVLGAQRSDVEPPAYRRVVPDFRLLAAGDFPEGSPFLSGYTYTTVVCEPRHYLPWLLRRYAAAGGRVETRKIRGLEELNGEYDLVVNCTGLASRELARDQNVQPIKGQVIKVRPRCPINVTTITDQKISPHSPVAPYIIPGRDVITLGGTKEAGVEDCDVDESLKKEIWESCSAIEPSLKEAELAYDWCGLRPSRRGGPRVELDAPLGPRTKLIHNYGHGGIGITLHWGSAGEVVKLVAESFPSAIRSKL